MGCGPGEVCESERTPAGEGDAGDGHHSGARRCPEDWAREAAEAVPPCPQHAHTHTHSHTQARPGRPRPASHFPRTLLRTAGEPRLRGRVFRRTRGSSTWPHVGLRTPDPADSCPNSGVASTCQGWPEAGRSAEGLRTAPRSEAAPPPGPKRFQTLLGAAPSVPLIRSIHPEPVSFFLCTPAPRGQEPVPGAPRGHPGPPPAPDGAGLQGRGRTPGLTTRPLCPVGLGHVVGGRGEKADGGDSASAPAEPREARGPAGQGGPVHSPVPTAARHSGVSPVRTTSPCSLVWPGGSLVCAIPGWGTSTPKAQSKHPRVGGPWSWSWNTSTVHMGSVQSRLCLCVSPGSVCWGKW